MEPVEPTGPQKKAGLGKWDYLPVPNGTTAVGYLAGYPLCCKTHHNNGTKPCRKWMSAHVLQCPFCNDGHEPDDRAYVPIWSREYLGQFVVVPYAYVESIREISLHAQVKLTRAKNPKTPVVIREEVWSPRPLPLTAGRREPVDLMEVLVRRIWRDKELERYADSVTATVTATTAAKPSAVPAAVVLPPVAAAFDLTAAVANEVLRQNGHHSRVVPDKDGNLVPLAEVLPALGTYNRKNKPK